ncbi:hypothetical protein [Lactococcus garvieae]|uniref:Phage protein n=1 Tax=Lactococcus garvieae DCC43 TaxID=1231377 RepID=K2PJN6_9LACT|nr:hypothetical protein [Lactococcus garvieae]EKF50439.1 hypothetical protein C426_2219 [Lactococcus garvieae DCC43]
MAKKQNVIDIKLTKNVQPVRIFGFDFEISMNLKKRTKQAENLKKTLTEIESEQKKIDGLVKSNDLAGLYQITEVFESKIKDIADEIFGVGAFDKLYEAADEDVSVIIAAMISFSEQFAQINTKQKMQSYIDGKKR